jgi:hypothetical protein
MKTLFNYPAFIYLVAGFACLAIMMIIDFILGVEAEHLNAWVIMNRLFGNNIGLPDSLAIRNFGLFGATLIMLSVNMVFGFFLINLLRGMIKLIHIIF